MKITHKLITTFIIILIFINILFPMSVHASDEDGGNGIDEYIKSGRSFLEKGGNEEKYLNMEALKKTSNKIYNTLFVIAIATAVIVGAYLGIKTMIHTAEADERVKIKDMLIPYIVGVVVIFLAYTIWSIVVNFGSNAFL